MADYSVKVALTKKQFEKLERMAIAQNVSCPSVFRKLLDEVSVIVITVDTTQ